MRGFKNIDHLYGQRYGKLIIESHGGYVIEDCRARPLVVCKCDCEIIKIAKLKEVLSGRIKSCGCLVKDAASKVNYTHGMSYTKEYRIYQAMIVRCTNSNAINFADYGGRGIVVSKRWLDCFENFIEDMGRLPCQNLSLDRIDNDKGYSKENCRWATSLQQRANRRAAKSSLLFAHNGKTMCLMEWTNLLGLKYFTIRSRIKRGWSYEKALELI